MAGKSNKTKKTKPASSLPLPDAPSLPIPPPESSDQLPVNQEETPVTVAGGDGGGATTGGDGGGAATVDELHLYPVSVKTLGGDKPLELQLNPADSVMDVKQFLLDAPETCFYTCYNLLLHSPDGQPQSLQDFHEISDVADITSGQCSLEMVFDYYDDRSVRYHVHRARELLSLSTLHASVSTALAPQPESSSRPSPGPKQDASKQEIVPELESFQFMEDETSTLNKLFSSTPNEIKCLESLVFSSFNPPPSYRRLLGDLIYLDVITLEGDKFCITGTTKSFYVNSSPGNVLDPTTFKTAFEATTLIGLLQKISPKFKKAFKEILQQKSSVHPFENVQSLLPVNSWLAQHPIADHRRDAARAENALTLTYRSELIGMQRDWNDELQSCREFPHTTPQEKILRDRALYKVTSDFVEAAMDGAIGVINRCIPPINAADPECFHMYVHNNIFFSFAVDGDLDQLPGKKKSNPIVKSNVLTNSKIVNGNALDKSSDGAVENGDVAEANGSDREDGDEAVNVTSDTPAENQVTDSEQATYASANNDLKGTKAYQEADVPGLYNLAMAIIDYRGHRIVTQSVLPGILQGDKSDSLLYGSVDNGKNICWNEDFHRKVLNAAKLLHLKEHSVLDESGNAFKLAAPVECKGIVGSDDRHYLLDLMRVTPRDANYTGPGSRFCILRPELIKTFCQVKATKRPDKLKSEEQAGLAPEYSECPSEEKHADSDLKDLVISNGQDVSEDRTEDAVDGTAEETCTAVETCDQICFNPNVLTEFKLAGSPQEIASDEDNVREASSYLANVVLPKFIQDLCTLEVSPMDGVTLTDALHAHGINVRYIGKVAEGTRHMPHLWDLCVNEITVRSAKHLLKDVLRDTEDHELGPAVSHFFNCFFGDSQAALEKSSSNTLQRRSRKDQGGHQKSSRGKYRWKNETSVKTSVSSYLGLSSERLWSEIFEFAKFKYQIDLPEDARIRVKKVAVIRNLCQKVGVSLVARKYDLGATLPFQSSDIMDLRPVVKHSIPVCSEAKDLVETGKLLLAEGMLGEAYTAFLEAFSILQQVTGPMHREVANCCRYLAMVLYHGGNIPAAIDHQHKELIINERCLGLDHPDTAHSYGNMALFYHGLGQTERALRHMARALLLLSLCSGPDHPDLAATFINVAMMYQDIRKMDTALRYLQEALKKNERLLGQEHIQTAVCYHALAIAFNCMGAYKLSHQHEKTTYEILVKQLGEEDARTRDSQTWMNTFKMREVQMNAQKQKAQKLDAASAQNALDIFKDLKAAAIARGSGSAASINKSLSSALMGGAVPRDRGLDERAARAAAVIKKKAASKGQSSNSQVPHGKPRNSINAVVSGSKKGVVADKHMHEAGHVTQGGQPSVEGNSTEAQNEAPVGLGKGLASLDLKKQKPTSKATN